MQKKCLKIFIMTTVTLLLFSVSIMICAIGSPQGIAFGAPAHHDLMGTGTATNPFLISSREDLEFFRLALNTPTTAPDRFSRYRGMHFRQTANIDLGGAASPWVPVGTTATPFTGSFDGGGFAISNMFVISSDSISNIGFFGQVNFSASNVIRNMNLDNVSIAMPAAIQNVGALIGNVNALANSPLTIHNCHASGSIMTSATHVGGLIGSTNATHTKVINDSSANVSVEGSDIVGGFVGRTQATTYNRNSASGNVVSTGALTNRLGGFAGISETTANHFRDCFATGNISTLSTAGTNILAGGFLGVNHIAATSLERVYASGNITIRQEGGNIVRAGGILGFSGTAALNARIATHIRHSAAINQQINQSGGTTRFVGRIGTGWTFTAAQMAAENVNNYALETMVNDYDSENPFPSTGTWPLINHYISEWSANTPSNRVLLPWDFRNIDTFANPVAISQDTVGLGWDFEDVWQIAPLVNSGLPTLRSFVIPTPEVWEGLGSRNNPHRITTVAELMSIRDAVNTGGNSFFERYISLESNLDLGGTNWEPIGLAATNPFSGTFLGNNYEIRGLHINRAVANNGFFGFVSNARIQDIIIIKPNIPRTAGNSVGAVVGHGANSHFYNLHVIGGFIGNQGANTGSIVGSVAGQSTIDYTSSSATISPQGVIGGIVGRADSANYGVSITRSFYTGYIEQSTSNVAWRGGILGWGQSVLLDQVWSNATINHWSTRTGGLVGGTQATAVAPAIIRNSYFSGVLRGIRTTNDVRVGGIIGWADHIQIYDSYFNGFIHHNQMSGSAAMGGIVGEVTQANAVFSNLVTAPAGMNNTRATRIANFTFASAANITSIRNNANTNLYLAPHTIWSSAPTIATTSLHSGGVGIQASTMQELTDWGTYTDTLNWRTDIWQSGEAASNFFPILQNTPSIDIHPPGQSGTATSPLLINNTQDLINFGNMVNTLNDRSIGLHVFVTASELDLTGIAWDRIGAGSAATTRTAFRGHFDGNGVVIRGLNITQTGSDRRGLFGNVGRGATIRNIVFEDSFVHARDVSGIVAGQLWENSIVENIEIRGNTTLIGRDWVGMVAGAIEAGSKVQNVHIHDNPTVTGRTPTGGIAGRIRTNATHNDTIVKDVSFNGTVQTTINTTANSLVGGLFGLMETTRAESLHVSDSFFFGTLNKRGVSINSTGGIAGRAMGVRFERVYTAGMITGGRIGGLVGEMITTPLHSSFHNTFSTATLLATTGTVASGERTAGGLIGVAAGAVAAGTRIYNSYSSSRIILLSSEVANSMGGLVGRTITANSPGLRIENSAAINPSMHSVAGNNSPIGRAVGFTTTAAQMINVQTLQEMELGHTISAVAVQHGTSQHNIEHFQNWATYLDMEWSDAVWTIDSYKNNGLPFLSNLPLFSNDEILGSENNPIEIHNIDDLIAFRNSVNGGNRHLGLTVRLMNNLDISHIPWAPIGMSAANNFSGTFDGNGFAIRGLNAIIGTSNFGFFGHTSGSTIRNLHFVNINLISTGNVSQVGVFVGNSASNLTIENSSAVGGAISLGPVNSNSNNVGGLVGQALGSAPNRITNSYAEINIRANNAQGGLVGRGSSLIINSCYFVGDLSGVGFAATTGATTPIVGLGGIVGIAQDSPAQITNVYTKGEFRMGQIGVAVAGHTAVGGIIGKVASTATGTLIENIYTTANLFSVTNYNHANGFAMSGGVVGVAGLTTQVVVVTVRNALVLSDIIEAQSSIVNTAARNRAAIIGTSGTNTARTSNLSTSTNNHAIVVTRRVLDNLGNEVAGNVLTDAIAFDMVEQEMPRSYWVGNPINYTIMLSWDMVQVWNIDPTGTFNEGLPFLRNAPINVELLREYIEIARRIYNENNFNQQTLDELYEVILDAEDVAMRASTEELTVEEIQEAIVMIMNAIAGLRAETQILEDYLEYLAQSIVPYGAYFTNFAMVEALINQASRMIESAGERNLYNNVSIQNMYNQLRAAVDSLVVDTAALRQLWIQAIVIEEDFFTIDSFENLQRAIEVASEILVRAVDDPTSLTPQGVAAAAQELRDAMEGLAVDMRELERLVEIGNELRTNYSAEYFTGTTWADFITEHDRGLFVLAQEKPSLRDVRDATHFLNIAINRLAPNKERLLILFNKALALSSSGHTVTSWQLLVDARTQAQAVLADSNATVSSVGLAYNELRAAFDGLVVDLSRLIEIINEGQRLRNLYTVYLSLPPGQYPTHLFVAPDDRDFIESLRDAPYQFPILVTAIDAAIAVRDSASPTPMQVESAADHLAYVINNIFTNRAMLQLFLDDARNIQWTYFTAESWDNLQYAIMRAENFLNDEENYDLSDFLSPEFLTSKVRMMQGLRAMVVSAMDELEVDKTFLSTLINEASALTEAHFTPSSWKNMMTRHNEGVLAYATYSPRQVNPLVSAIVNLRTAIELLIIDKSDLEYQIMRAQAKNIDDFELSGWTNMITVYNWALSVFLNSTSSAETVLLATDTLRDALDALIVKKDMLLLHIDLAKERLSRAEVPKNQFVPVDTVIHFYTGVQGVLDAIEKAALANRDDASLEEVNAAIQAISTAIDGLTLDRAPLSELIARANELDSSEFTESSWASFLSARNNAVFFVNIHMTAPQLRAEYIMLLNAIDNLRADKGRLMALIQEARRFRDPMLENQWLVYYFVNQDTWNDFWTTYQYAITTYENPNASLAEVNNAIDKLTNALYELNLPTSVDTTIFFADFVTRMMVLQPEWFYAATWDFFATQRTMAQESLTQSLQTEMYLYIYRSVLVANQSLIADLTALRVQIDRFLATDIYDYNGRRIFTQGTYDRVLDAFAQATYIYNQTHPSGAKANDAMVELRTALDTLLPDPAELHELVTHALMLMRGGINPPSDTWFLLATNIWFNVHTEEIITTTVAGGMTNITAFNWLQHQDGTTGTRRWINTNDAAWVHVYGDFWTNTTTTENINLGDSTWTDISGKNWLRNSDGAVFNMVQHNWTSDSFYTQASWNALRTQVIASANVLRLAQPTRAQIETAINNIIPAIEGLTLQGGIINQLIIDALNIDANNYTRVTHGNLINAVEEAKIALEIHADAIASGDADAIASANEGIEDAAQGIIDAKNALISVRELNEKMSVIGTLFPNWKDDDAPFRSTFGDHGWDNLLATLYMNAIEFENGTPESIALQVVSINDALRYLVFGQASGLVQAHYTTVSWNEFQGILQDALDTEFNLDNIFELGATIQQAIYDLVSIRDLQLIVAQVGLLQNAHFTPESWNGVLTAITNVYLLYEDGSQAQIDIRIKQILEAVDSLVFAPTLDASEFTTVSYNTVIVKRDALRGLLDDLVSSNFYVEINDTVEELTNALAGLVTISELDELLEYVGLLDSSVFTPSTWNALQNAVNSLPTVYYLRYNGTQAQVDARIAAIRSAIDNLRLDKSALQELISLLLAKNLRAQDFTIITWTDFQTAFNAAQNEFVSIHSTADTILSATQNLQAAFDSLVSVIELRAIMAEVNSLTPSDWDVVAWGEVVSVINSLPSIDTLYESGTDEEIATRIEEIRIALDNLFVNPNRSQLESLINFANGLVEEHNTTYSWRNFQGYLSYAKVELYRLEATPQTINNARENLQTAINNLVNVQSLRAALVRFEEVLPYREEFTLESWTVLYDIINDGNDELLYGYFPLLTRDQIATNVINRATMINNAIDALVRYSDMHNMLSLYPYIYNTSLEQVLNIIDGDNNERYLVWVAAQEQLSLVLNQFVNPNSNLVILAPNGEILDHTEPVLAMTNQVIQLLAPDDTVLDSVTIVVRGDLWGTGTPGFADVTALVGFVSDGQALGNAELLAADIWMTGMPGFADITSLVGFVSDGQDIFNDIRLSS